MKTLHELFEDGIKDIYNAEKQLIKALPKMVKMAKNKRLKEGFQNHLRQTEGHARRVEQAAQSLGMKPTGMVCRAMKGLVEEASEHMSDLKPSACADAELIALAQKVEHYEIGTYGTLCTWAELMGHTEAHDLFKQNLEEEKQTDELLTQVANSEVNEMAVEETDEAGMGKKSKSGGSKTRRTGGTMINGKMRGASPAGRSSGGRKSTTGRSATGRSSGRSPSGSRPGGSTPSRGSKSGSSSGRSSSRSKSGGPSMR